MRRATAAALFVLAMAASGDAAADPAAPREPATRAQFEGLDALREERALLRGSSRRGDFNDRLVHAEEGAPPPAPELSTHHPRGGCHQPPARTVEVLQPMHPPRREPEDVLHGVVHLAIVPTEKTHNDRGDVALVPPEERLEGHCSTGAVGGDRMHDL